MRIVFIGTGEVGLPALRSLLRNPAHDVVGVVTQPDKPVGRKQELSASAIKQLALASGVPVEQPLKIRMATALEPLRAWAPEVIIVMAYGQILPRELLELPPRACLNLHASLLPRHRGAAPIQAAILAGDHETGITVMHVDVGLDTGDILWQKSLPIHAHETGGSLHDRLADLAPVAMNEALALLEQGSAHRIPQDNAAASYAPKLERQHGAIDWRLPAEQLERKVRAFNPWPSAWTFLPDRAGAPRQLKIHDAVVSENAGKPGEVLRADESGLLVATGGGALLLRELQLEGKKRMSAAEFLRGNPVAPGTQLETAERPG